MAKEDPEFWSRLETMLGFDPGRTLLADDTEKVLRAADQYGLAHLIYVARSSSMQPVSYSATYPSIDYFKELMAR